MLPFAVDSTYWQQRIAYEIVASLNESSGVLSGNVRISYVNKNGEMNDAITIRPASTISLARPG